MKRASPDDALLLEIGLGLSVLAVAGCIAVLLGGRLFGGAKRANRRQEPPPTPSSVPAERQQHIAAVSAR